MSVLFISGNEGSREMFDVLKNELNTCYSVGTEHISYRNYVGGDNITYLTDLFMQDVLTSINASQNLELIVIGALNDVTDFSNLVRLCKSTNRCKVMFIMDVFFGSIYIDKLRVDSILLCDYISVPNSDAYDYFNSLTNKCKIFKGGNPAFDELVKYKKWKNRGRIKPNVLFIEQPLSRYGMGNSLDVLKGVAKILDKHFGEDGYTLNIKLHPETCKREWDKYGASIVEMCVEELYKNVSNYDLYLGHSGTIQLKTSILDAPTSFLYNLESNIEKFKRGEKLDNKYVMGVTNSADIICRYIVNLISM